MDSASCGSTSTRRLHRLRRRTAHSRPWAVQSRHHLRQPKVIASELAKFLGVDEAVPATFQGIPILQSSPGTSYLRSTRTSDHIDGPRRVFAAGIRFADSNEGEDQARTEFAAAFDGATGGQVWPILTFGLYWMRPWAFLSLDNNSQNYVTKKLGVPLGLHGPKKRCNSTDYPGRDGSA